MEQHFRIKGMHCNGCTRKVERALATVPGVTSVKVSLPSSAVIESVTSVPLATLESALSAVGTYPIALGRTLVLERLYPFVPLALMFSIVLTWATAASIVSPHAWHAWMQHFMGGFFLLFGTLKVINLKNFALMYRGYDLLARKVPAWGYVYPFVEFALGILYTLGLFALQTNIVTIVVMTFGSIGIARKLRSGGQQTCACLGGFFSVPLTWITVAENLLMVGMALYMIALL